LEIEYYKGFAMKKIILIIVMIFFFLFNFTFAQTRYAVLPFQNGEGKIDLNLWSYLLQDSIQKVLATLDPEEKYCQIVPADSVEEILADLNVDPNNPQYPTDMWKAVKILNVDKVISGIFYFRGNRLIINAYIYDVKTKLADPRYKVENIFKEPDKALSAVEIIVNKMKPAFLGN